MTSSSTEWSVAFVVLILAVGGEDEAELGGTVSEDEGFLQT